MCLNVTCQPAPSRERTGRADCSGAFLLQDEAEGQLAAHSQPARDCVVQSPLLHHTGGSRTPYLLYLPAFAMCWPPEIHLPPSPPIAHLFFLQNTIISLPQGPQRGPQEGLLAGADITGPAHTPWVLPICCVQPLQLPALVSLRPGPFYRTATACSF